ncbi:MAG: hypothetical protein HYX47_06240 [Burkholderiales bacterium]|nr:hypothetical protein [Burkholderiales bacterium]
MNLPALAQINEGLARADAAMLQGDLQLMHDATHEALELLAALAHAGQAARAQTPAPAPWNETEITSALWQILAQLRRAGCGAFPFAGTLLGLERDGRLLPNDKDADLGVWLEDFTMACRTLQAMGLQRAGNGPPFGNMACFVLGEPRLSIDLFGIRREPEHNRMVGGVWLYGRPPSHQRITHYPWFTLASRDGPSGEVWWPEPPAALLGALYGNWRRPQPEWDSLVSCLAVQETNLQWRCFALKNLCDSWLAGNLPRTRRLVDQIVARGGPDAALDRWAAALDAGMAAKPAG